MIIRPLVLKRLLRRIIETALRHFNSQSIMEIDRVHTSLLPQRNLIGDHRELHDPKVPGLWDGIKVSHPC
jgi:hypothetical protein